jgi:pimeloyl-ACP methyl ester carboxylesterase
VAVTGEAVPAAAEIYVPRRTARRTEVVGREGRIALTHWGPAHDSPIVLLHGWMDCAAAWQLLVDWLPEDWPLVAIDWPGYGHSAWHERHYWFPEHLAELDWLLDEVSPRHAARLIAHSMGGGVASMYAGIRPERVAWIVNMEGFGMPALKPGDLPALAAGWLDALRAPPQARRYDSLDALVATVRRANPRLTPAAARYLATVWTRETERGLEMRADPRQQLRAPIRYARAEVEAFWARVRAPLLLLHGADSDHLQRALGEAPLARLAQLFADLRAEAIPDAGHLLPYEQPQRVAEAIVRFVATLPAAG